MEKGDGNADIGQLEEVKGVESEGKVAVAVHGPKEPEEDEVFEEAVGSAIPEVDSEDRVVSHEIDNGEIGDSVGPLEVSQSLDNGDKVEKFEEAISAEENDGVLASEVPSFEMENQTLDETPNGVRESVEKDEGFVRELPSGEEAKEAASKILNGNRESGEEAESLVTEEESPYAENTPDELLVHLGEEGKNDLAEDIGGHALRDLSMLDGSIRTANSRDEGKVHELAVEALQKPSNGIAYHLNGDLIQDGDTDKWKNDNDNGFPGTQDANEVKGGDTDSGQKVKSNGDVVHSDVTSNEANELYGTPAADTKENRVIELEINAATLDSEHHGGMDGKKGDVISSVDEATIEPEKVKPQNQGNEEKDDGVPSASGTDGQVGSGTLKDSISSSLEEISQEPKFERTSATSDDFSIEERAKAPVEESIIENFGPSQPQVASSNGEVPKVLVKHPDRKSMEDEEAKPGTTSSTEGVKPSADSSPSIIRSVPSPAPAARPAGLGRAAPLLEPARRVVQQQRVNGAAPAPQNQVVEEPSNGEEEFDETREKLQMIRVKFLRLAHRLGQTPHNVVVAQVLYRLGLAEQLRGRNGSRVAAFSFDRASAMAEQLEAAGQEALDFSCTIMVLGKTGVGKSATINSIFDEVKFGTDAFQMGTKKVQDVVGTVQGIKVRVIDTPGLLPSWSDQRQNEKILHSVKRFIKKTPPDIVLYLDRLDMQSRDFGDMPLLRTITDIFGPSIWFNAIVVLTHAASAPPEGPNGTATSYDMFVTQRSHVVQNAIRQAAGDMRLMNPVSLVENHSACRTNPAGQRVLPNGQVWKPHLLLLSFASKILAEANTLLKLQDSSPPGRPFTTRTRAPPLPFLLSSLLQSRPQVKLPTDQYGDDDDSLDDDVDESSDSEDESEYDQLPPFRNLTKAQLAKLPRDQRKAYYAELEYREKLFMKKQLKEEKKRRRMMKKMQDAAKDLPNDPNESVEEENGGAASVPVPMPDLVLPASFDSDNPTHRYRCLDSSNQWLVRPVLEPNGWDHDVGYEGINVERLFVVKERIPFSFSGQVSKDKKDTNLQMEVASSVKHGEGKTSSLGFDMQTVGKDIAYTLRGESRFMNYRRNKATTGLSVTVLGDTVTGGVKIEDKLIVNKRGLVVVSGGAMFGRGDVAYGGSLEATLRDKDHPLGRFLSTLGLSVMDWHGDLAIGCNSQTQIPIGRHTNLIGRVNINNKGSGQVSIRLNSSEQLQIALIALIPIAKKLLGYSQSAQFV